MVKSAEFDCVNFRLYRIMALLFVIVGFVWGQLCVILVWENNSELVCWLYQNSQRWCVLMIWCTVDLWYLVDEVGVYLNNVTIFPHISIHLQISCLLQRDTPHTYMRPVTLHFDPLNLATKIQDSSWCQLFCYWWHHRLSSYTGIAWLRASCLNPLCAKFFRGNINIYLHFVSFLHIDATQVFEILPQIRQEPTYST